MSRAYSLAGTTYIAKKPFTQWDGLMKMYYKKHEVTCKVSETPVDEPLDLHAEVKFPTGSSYEGAINVLGMGGYGEYTFPNGVMYRGELQDGRFHGFGELVYKDGPEAESIIQGHWIKGVLTDPKILFNGKLQYEANNWKYCLIPDRRYALEYDTGLRPAGQSLITAEEPMRPIPPGYYDTGDGFYNPKTKMVYDYEHKVVKRSPSHRERKWILDNCRKEPMEKLGPRQDLYEKWVEPIVDPITIPEPLVNYRWTEPRELSVSESETSEEENPIFYDSNLLYTLATSAHAMDYKLHKA